MPMQEATSTTSAETYVLTASTNKEDLHNQ